MISFASAAGNLFNRWGKLGLLIKQAALYQAAQLTNMTDTVNGVVAQYNSESDIQALMGSAYISNLSGPESVASTAQAMAVATANRVVFRDNPQINQTLTSANTPASITEIIRQMRIAGATILAQTVTGTPTGFTGTGNGAFVISVRRPQDGLVQENAFAETLTLKCTADSYNGGAAAGNESFRITGQGSQSDLFAFNWPLGSNASTTLQAINGDTSNGQGNLLTNSGFASFAALANVPNNWLLQVGTAGTNIFQETTNVYTGGSAVRLVGDAAGTLTQIRQRFGGGSTNSTPGTLSPLTQYSFNIFMRGTASPPAAGVLTVELVDQNGTVLNDANAQPNSLNFSLTGLTVNYAAFNGVFRTPLILPTTSFIRYRLSTALTNGATVYLGKSSLGQMTRVYTSGPYVATHSGSVPFVKGDYATAAVTNSRGAGGTLNTFQTLLYRILNPFSVQNEFVFPSSSVPTVSDSLIG